MSSTIEHAREGIEHAGHAGPDRFNRLVAVLIAALAAGLALAEMAERSAQNAYLTHHIAVSDHWTFFGFKSTRARVVEQTAILLAAQPGADTNPAIQTAIEDAKRTALRMREGEPNDPGTRQIQQQAEQEVRLRDRAHHRYEGFEIITSALQIAIVLASVAVVTRVRIMAAIGGLVGVAAGIGAALIATGVV